MLKKVQKKPLVIQRISFELPGKYFSSGVNVLTNGLKMSDFPTDKRHFPTEIFPD